MFIGTIFEFLNIIHNLLVFVGQFYIIRIFLWYKEQSETVKIIKFAGKKGQNKRVGKNIFQKLINV